MKYLLTVVLVLLGAVLLTGMGNLGGTPEGTVNKTGENIKVQVVDRKGVSTELAWFSMDGKEFIEGRRGEGKMNVVLHQLKEISFGPVKGEEVIAELLYKTGSRHQLQLNKSDKFSGDTGFGVYWITAADISRVIFH